MQTPARSALFSSAINIAGHSALRAECGRMDDAAEERLRKMESHLAHLERLYEQLNEVVVEQGRQLGRALAQLQRIGQTIEDVELDRIKSTNPKPPHYQ
jgi:uncharacterized coiled-coil protein SlyX